MNNIKNQGNLARKYLEGSNELYEYEIKTNN